MVHLIIDKLKSDKRLQTEESYAELDKNLEIYGIIYRIALIALNYCALYLQN